MQSPSASKSTNPSRSPRQALRRTALYLLSVSPVIALLVLLAWGELRADGNPGSRLEYDETGEVAVNVRPAPDFVGIDLVSGASVSQAGTEGNVVMVDFWSSWCAACRIEAAGLAAVYAEYADQPVEFVGVAIWDVPGDVLRYLDRYSVTYPNVLDERGRTAVRYGVAGVPEKFFLDREGNIVRRINGPLPPEKLREVLDELLAS